MLKINLEKLVLSLDEQVNQLTIKCLLLIFKDKFSIPSNEMQNYSDKLIQCFHEGLITYSTSNFAPEIAIISDNGIIAMEDKNELFKL